MVAGSTESLLQWVAEANQLVAMGSVGAARALLQGLLSNPTTGALVSCKALYWVARAKIEEVGGGAGRRRNGGGGGGGDNKASITVE